MRVKDDDKGNGASLNGLDPTFVPMKGLRSRELARIGANGVMVLRMGSALGRDAGHCRLQRRTRLRVPQHFLVHWEQLLFTLTLDEAGEPSGAIRDPRERPPRRPTCPTAEASAPSISRRGKRVKWASLKDRLRCKIHTMTKVDTAVMPVDFMTKWLKYEKMVEQLAYLINSRHAVWLA